MPPTRREQLELDELLSDIYRGIETLPTSHQRQLYSSPAARKAVENSYARSQVKEYEVPASSPLVKQHKQELAALRGSGSNSYNTSVGATSAPKQPQRSTLKRHTPEQQGLRQQQQQPQSLALFVTSTTPDNKRRVRIVDHPDKLAKGYNSNSAAQENNNSSYYYDDYANDHEDDDDATGGRVKYVNTNKLIYHQERNPDDEELSDSDNNSRGGANRRGHDEDEEEEDADIDGATRVEYYHTTWLDRQLGRASKRRSSKELNERQVKEKAMIEELKRSLKNGAITLRQSFKGKKSAHKNSGKPSETYDDHMLDSGRHASRQQDNERNRVFGSGLATIPRNYQHNSRKQLDQGDNFDSHRPSHSADQRQLQAAPKQTRTAANATSDYNATNSTPATTAPIYGNFDSVYQPSSATTTTVLPDYQQQQSPDYSSRTLPHNYQSSSKGGQHQLLQSHYRGANKNFNTITSSARQTTLLANSNSQQQTPKPATTSGTMRNYGNPSNGHCAPNSNYGAKSPIISQRNQHQLAQSPPPPRGETISSIPSATEVVRSALSRSGSQVSLHQLNKTINLLPTSPPPYGSTPATPTQQLRPASPSLSPSPSRSPIVQHTSYAQQQPQYSSRTLGSADSRQQQQACSPGALHGTRTVSRPPQQTEHFQQRQQQPIYANPHASLMQHRAEQQMRTPQSRNAASIREFNELDSLLRSLSPGGVHTTTHITPGYSSRPSQPTFGGYSSSTAAPAPAQQQHVQPAYQQPPARPAYGVTSSHQQTSSDIYAKVRKQPQPQQQQQQPAVADQTKASYLQQHYMPTTQQQQTHDPYTLDVSEKRDSDELCLTRQNLSEFEPQIELVPSMEDYQNITLLNPVKNHYWYKPNMSRERAISLLKDKPQGTFIVRDSTSFKGAYGLAVKVARLPKNVLQNANLRNPNGDPSAELIRHFLIEPTVNGVRLKGYANEPVFDNLPNLIYQHSLTELALPCKLVIPRADIEDPKFIHKQKQFFDEFVASKEQAKHQPYERTSPDGGFRRYPGNVYVHNEHRIIYE